MAVPGFTTVVGPVATDSANGATAYNTIATQTEVNYPRFSNWIKIAEAAFPVGSAVVTGTAFVTPASGWAFEGTVYRDNWAKKWGGATYVSLAMKRTGTALPYVLGGNMGDSIIGTLSAGYRPLDNLYISAVCTSGGVYQLYINTAGAIVVYSAGGNYGLRASQSLLFNALFANGDLQPF